jgi:protein-S-isoprenylcysteine O-methyltransferase Ste14
MRKPAAAAGSTAFFLLAPGVVAGLIPRLITGWDTDDPPVPLVVIGAALVLAGVAVLAHAFARFVLEGLGTPAPAAPPERLVVGGLYRHVRNPMYVAVVSVIAGQALLLNRPVLLLYAAVVGAVVASFVHLWEEPDLRRRFGASYEEYRRAVPAWRPRLRPWRPGGSGESQLRH